VDVFLETERLVLRRFTMDDVDLVVALDADPLVMRYISGGPPTPREEIVEDILPAWLSYYERFAGYGFWAVQAKQTGTFLGWFHFRPSPGRALDDVELGYRLRQSAWGRGYATEGSRALIAKGFSELGVQRVFATTMVVNTASRRVMEKAGLHLVRVFETEWPVRIEGDEQGEVEYALTREEWLASGQLQGGRVEKGQCAG
jgi:RimJ/RimL family protein N-acetyltransferase